MSKSPEEIFNAWRESAQYWEKYSDTIRQMFAPVTRALIEDGAITKGHRVLDVAGGAGEPSLSIAEEIAPSGSVLCTDIAPEMVAAAERLSQKRNISNISFQICSAQSLPFEDLSFDRVVCRFGAMFFPDPLTALQEILRVTRPQGRITFAVWSTREANPLFSVVTDALSRYVQSPPEPPDAPGAFRFAEPGLLAGLLASAGAINVEERMLSFKIEAPLSFDEFWPVRSQMSESLREKLRQLTADQTASLVADIREMSREYFREGRMSFPAEAIIACGEKPVRG
jgi:SAM-dependent methyltransferase